MSNLKFKSNIKTFKNIHPTTLWEVKKKLKEKKEAEAKREKTEEEILDECFAMHLLQSPLIY